MRQTEIIAFECFTGGLIHVRLGAHPLVSSCDVLQGSSGRLAGGGIDLTLMQHTVVHTHYLRVPQPLHPLWHTSNLSESREIPVLLLLGEEKYKEKAMRWLVWSLHTKC